MSGGSWDYFYARLDEVCDRLEHNDDPLRRALGKRLRPFSSALHDIEWVDSCDYCKEQERESIEKALGESARALEISEATLQAEAAINRLQLILNKPTPS